MSDTPPDWVLIEAAKRCEWDSDNIEHVYRQYQGYPAYRALCDMILKHEQPPVDRKLLCAREALREAYGADKCVEWTPEQEIVRAIELWEDGFGK
jgi:hypothetical protein